MINPLYPMFILFGPIWFLLVGLLSIFIYVCLESRKRDNMYAAYFWLVVGLLILSGFCYTPLPNLFATASLSGILIGILSYIAAGAIVGIIKWIVFCYNVKDLYIKYKKEKYTHKEIEDSISRFFYDYYYFSVPLKAKEHYDKIIAWMVFWPISLIHLLLSDFISLIYKNLIKLLSGMMDSISKSVFGNLEIKNED